MFLFAIRKIVGLFIYAHPTIYILYPKGLVLPRMHVYRFLARLILMIMRDICFPYLIEDIRMLPAVPSNPRIQKISQFSFYIQGCYSLSKKYRMVSQDVHYF